MKYPSPYYVIETIEDLKEAHQMLCDKRAELEKESQWINETKQTIVALENAIIICAKNGLAARENEVKEAAK